MDTFEFEGRRLRWRVVLDRCIKNALRLYHYEEQTRRQDVDTAHLDSVQGKLAVCHAQHADLSQSLTELARNTLSVWRRTTTIWCASTSRDACRRGDCFA